MTKQELINRFLSLYRCKNYSLALATKRNDAMRVLQIKTELSYLLNIIVPSILGCGSKSYKDFKRMAYETLEEQRLTKEELKKEFVI